MTCVINYNNGDNILKLCSENLNKISKFYFYQANLLFNHFFKEFNNEMMG